jgi:hypothetical protein
VLRAAVGQWKVEGWAEREKEDLDTEGQKEEKCDVLLKPPATYPEREAFVGMGKK